MRRIYNLAIPRVLTQTFDDEQVIHLTKEIQKEADELISLFEER